MDYSRKRRTLQIRVLIPAILIGIAVVVSCWSAGVLARKGRVDRARAPLPALNAKREPTERVADGWRAGMPALQSLAFEANEGQADAAVKFLARSARHQLLLTSRSVILRSLKGSVGIEFAGANASNGMEGTAPLPGHRNYLLGNDPRNWHTGVSTFQKVLYRDVYPGINLI